MVLTSSRTALFNGSTQNKAADASGRPDVSDAVVT
jgi:hypothetical protein